MIYSYECDTLIECVMNTITMAHLIVNYHYIIIVYIHIILYLINYELLNHNMTHNMSHII